MNTQQQEINVIQHENQWQAPTLVELGEISNETQFSGGHGGDFSGMAVS
ncbi:hypothetical protein [uncultured Tolumonas sp.]|nr:hypothetical protein [uncultured Tolumonas sp.]